MRKWFFRRVVLSWVLIFLLMAGWYTVFQQEEALIETNMIPLQKGWFTLLKKRIL